MLRGFLLILILSAGTLFSVAETDEKSASQRYLEAFLLVNDGERLEKDGHFREAYVAYFNSSQQLKALCAANPSNADDLRPALKKLDAKLGELKKKLGS